jgi:hypothetical protein
MSAVRDRIRALRAELASLGDPAAATPEERTDAYAAALRDERHQVEAAMRRVHGDDDTLVRVPETWAVGGVEEYPAGQLRDDMRQRISEIDAELKRVGAKQD